MEAVKKMKNGCILNGGVGSGKSRTALYYYCSLYDEDNRPPLYIITTAKKRDDHEWELEAIPFRITDIHIDSWNNIQKYKNEYGGFFIFDEDRVTGSGKWVKAFYKIAKKNKWIILSATPGDSWEQYIPVFVANGFYKNKTDFQNQHVVYSRFTTYPKIDKFVGTKKLNRLRDSILIPMDVERHTERIVEYVYCDYDREKYRYITKNRFDIFKNEPIEQAAGLCYCLRKLTNSDESRQSKLLELLEDHDKAIIFYNFDYELDILKNLGYAKGTKIAEWNGHSHQEVPKTKRWVYLVQYSAGCEGWNCVTTDTIIFYSLNYSYKTVEQAQGRIDRLNTPYAKLHYYFLSSHASIDIAIKKALSEKKLFNERRFSKFG